MATWIEHPPPNSILDGSGNLNLGVTFTPGPPIGPLPPGQKPIIEIAHDEASFCSKDGVRLAWVYKDSLLFYDKGRGKCIICHGPGRVTGHAGTVRCR
jgi:hypothetical protein